MGTFSAVAVYISLNVILNVGLALRVIQLRYRTRTSGGGGGHPGLEWAICAHGNNAEYAPFALAALIFLALLDAPTLLVHSVGLSYTVGRCLVAWAHGWNQAAPGAPGRYGPHLPRAADRGGSASGPGDGTRYLMAVIGEQPRL